MNKNKINVRSIQKTGTKELGGKPGRARTDGARYILLRPAGYPLKSVFQDSPVVSDPRLFERYAREQWYGEVVKPGGYLFDRRLYPDFAFKVIRAYPHESVVGSDTKIVVEKRKMKATNIESNLCFEDIVGQEDAKRKMKIIERFLAEPKQFGKWAPRNILFYGPSGTGKTMMAKALSGKTKMPMLSIKATTLIGEFVGEGSKQIHRLYERAEQMTPCIIFIDEMDAIALDRRYQDLRGDVSEVVNALLTEMDGIKTREGICTVSATNKIEFLDESIRSRFEEEIKFNLPTEEERNLILEKNIVTLPVESLDVDLKTISVITEGFSGRDLVEKVLKVALHRAIIENTEIRQLYLEQAVKKAKKCTPRDPPVGMFF
ncbi:MAG: AAA family ATPase [Methanotrichaceae archaeon]